MGVKGNAGNCAIRISIGRTTKAEDIEYFIAAWTALRDRARAAGSAPLTSAA